MADHPEFCSGTWTGFYLESHRAARSWMHLYLNCSRQGKIIGEGIDYVGPWTAEGMFLAETRTCRWVKSYVGRHTVIYLGQLDEFGISGHWQIGLSTGPFRIWPESKSYLNAPFFADE